MAIRPIQQKRMKGLRAALASCLVAFLLAFASVAGCATGSHESTIIPSTRSNADILTDIPEYSGEDFVILNDGVPDFTAEDLSRSAFESYTSLDRLGRCGQAFAMLGLETMPNAGEKRTSISHIHPSGWKQAYYDFLTQEYLFSRSHLIAWQLAAENDNELNLITGTYYMNANVMLNFENGIRSYIKTTGNHVLYRVTPDFRDDELVARGLQLEAQSVEDGGEGIRMNVYLYNVQPGVAIDYATGESWAL